MTSKSPIIENANPDAQAQAALFMALAKAQGMFTEVRRTKTAKFKTKSGGEVEYKYAELSDVIDMVREPLAKNGLAFFQRVVPADHEGRFQVETVLCHEAGGYINAYHPMFTTESPLLSTMQRLGVAETFARRYSLQMILGIATEEDIDDNERREPVRDNVPEVGPRAAAAVKKTKEARELKTEIIQDIESADSLDALTIIAKSRKTEIDKLPTDYADEIRSAYKARRDEIVNEPQDHDLDLNQEEGQDDE